MCQVGGSWTVDYSLRCLVHKRRREAGRAAEAITASSPAHHRALFCLETILHLACISRWKSHRAPCRAVARATTRGRWTWWWRRGNFGQRGKTSRGGPVSVVSGRGDRLVGSPSWSKRGSAGRFKRTAASGWAWAPVAAPARGQLGGTWPPWAGLLQVNNVAPGSAGGRAQTQKPMEPSPQQTANGMKVQYRSRPILC